MNDMNDTPHESLLRDLIDVGTGKIAHLNMGLCPGIVEGHDTRDDECPACKVLMQATEAATPKP